MPIRANSGIEPIQGEELFKGAEMLVPVVRGSSGLNGVLSIT